MHSETDSDGDTGTATDGETAKPTGTPGLGRRILLAVGVTVIVISGGLGWFVGSNGELSDAAVLGTGFTVPVTPGALALYGVVVSTGLLGGLFGLVELASRVEGGSRAE
ncbi:hypothetical protein [Halobellus salinus]|uniref:hypothetical protein n=1 Tax=Halobellus salinus TaxID=931585 RepID=UPI001E2B8704|nr:hypothetical protein [Halobellus salinus]SMP05595.1 hypothetical protein SAMN06265347_10296 [Halobellus salinus]